MRLLYLIRDEVNRPVRHAKGDLALRWVNWSNCHIIVSGLTGGFDHR